MFYYQEITLIDQAEVSSYFIWSKLYGQVHIALVEIKDQNNKVNIGVSFPQYVYHKEEQKPKVSLGNKLRLFAETEENLKQLNVIKWLKRLKDYVHISSIRPVPQSKVIAYVSFQRKQFKTSTERLARHRMKKRNDINFDEAVKWYQNIVTTTDLPFVQMKSLTTNQQFKLFIQKNVGKKVDECRFSTFGLSAESTVPDF